jgi:hypothetical protein
VKQLGHSGQGAPALRFRNHRFLRVRVPTKSPQLRVGNPGPHKIRRLSGCSEPGPGVASAGCFLHPGVVAGGGGLEPGQVVGPAGGVPGLVGCG